MNLFHGCLEIALGALEDLARFLAEVFHDRLDLVLLLVGELQILGNLFIGERLGAADLQLDLLEAFGLFRLEDVGHGLVGFFVDLLAQLLELLALLVPFELLGLCELVLVLGANFL